MLKYLWILGVLMGCMNDPHPHDLTKDSPIRGVWLTNVASDALTSPEKIREAVDLCSDLGFNTIFMVAWNDGFTLYKSKTAEKVTGYMIDPKYQDYDPMQELITYAHHKNIKVYGWFEFGFAASHRDSTGGMIIQAKPHWASRDKEGKITEKNDFQWMNPFHPQVQSFLTNLIMDAVNNYDLDGIQGDDRFPALPTNGGYDDYTVALYKSEHNNRPPPENEKDYGWIKWRSDKLNQYLQDFVTTIRQVDPHISISMAPSIYPWSEENYLQDWPAWVNMGLVDNIIPQIYRYNADSYTYELQKIKNSQIDKNSHTEFYPGVLLQVNDYNPSLELLEKFVDFNRKSNINGEVFFFYEGIKKYPQFFKKIYHE